MLTANILGVSHAYEITDPQTAVPETAVPEAAAEQLPTLTCIHGWMMSRAYWRPLAQALLPQYRCLSYDLRGFGESSTVPDLTEPHSRQVQLPANRILAAETPAVETPAAETPAVEALAVETPAVETTKHSEIYEASTYSLAAYAQDLEALLDKLKIKSTWLLGHSLGGSIALWAAYLFPERVRGVICINAGGGIYIPKEFEKFRSAGQQMVKFRPAWLQRAPLLPRLFARMMVKQPLGLSWGQQRIRDFLQADMQAAKGALLETTTPEEVHLLPQVIGQITQPVHFITATNDTVMPPRYVRYLASFHPHFQAAQTEETVSEIANCGHMAMVEQPQRVADIVREVIGAAAD